MKIINGNLLDISQGLITRQVNTKGVMGAGLALQIRQKYPDVYNQYLQAVQQKQIRLGYVQIIQVSNRLWVANLAGQESYGRGKNKCYTNYSALKHGLFYLKMWQNCSNENVYLPYGMGAGLSGGDWSIIKDLIEQELPNAILIKH